MKSAWFDDPQQSLVKRINAMRLTRWRESFSSISAECALMIFILALIVLSSYDAVKDIPPLADDFWLIEKAPGKIFLDHIMTNSWLFRPVGFIVIDAANSFAKWSGTSIVWPVLVVRAITLAMIYMGLRLLFKLPLAVALVALIFFALTPSAGEGWTMLCVLGLAFSVPFVVFTCGCFVRAAEKAQASNHIPWLLVGSGCVLQFLTFTLYDQTVLAIPVFICILLFTAVGSRRLSRRIALQIVSITGGVSGIWLSALLLSGYLSSRYPQSGAEISDLVLTLRHLWMAFIKHNLWRAVEMIRTGHWGWWDATRAGVLAMTATWLVAVVVGLVLLKGEKVQAPTNQVTLSSSIAGPVTLIFASLVAAYLTILPIELVSPDFNGFSRMFYTPGLFIGLAIGCLTGIALRYWRLQTTLVVTLLVLWNGTLTRRYLSDMRDGARIVQAVTGAVSELPSTARARGILIIAPEVVGTFSTSSVQPWSLRSAIRGVKKTDVEGPLFFATSCADAIAPDNKIRDENSLKSSVRDWGAVVEYRRDRTIITPTLNTACQIENVVNSANLSTH